MKENVSPFHVEQLHWPKDRWRLAFLSISQLQTWYLAQDPKAMITIADTPEFKRYWYFVYVVPVRFYRSLLKIKRLLRQEPWPKATFKYPQ